ncbi:hypothetical protein OIU34_24070 [Pararhizobium sp. BT-229]|uniref:hypothetical protein n=1 Tax=Pararhizobium sp. BT-229 TaxID=2986923 RepID=UPI0021F6A60B|nr:hypothetical protein [Pararhizobium sp. BT-229]MCV9964976.1 hypothetical protein [Pararhizobium sp. BT-229]
MADFIDRKTGDKLFSDGVSDDHMLHIGNEIELESRGTVRRYRITNIVLSYKRVFLIGVIKSGDPKIFLEEVERDTADKIANWL